MTSIPATDPTALGGQLGPADRRLQMRLMIWVGWVVAALTTLVVGAVWWLAADAQGIWLVLMMLPSGILALIWLGWVIGLLVVARRWSWWACLAPAIAIAGIVVAGLGLPYRVSWHFAQDDFEAALPAIIASDGREVPDSISHYDILFARVFDDRVYFAFSGAGIADCGMAHLPDGLPTQSDTIGDGISRIDQYSGHWYRFCAGW